MKYEKLKIFDHFIIKHKVPDYLFDSKSLKLDVEKLFDNEFITKREDNSPEIYGEAYTTCGFDSKLVTNLTDIDILLQYINTFILYSHRSESVGNKKVIYSRVWANKVYKGCSGKCHAHGGDIDGTAIFYYISPPNGSNLIVLKEKIEGLVLDKHKDISHHIEVVTGDLIIHKKDVYHAISRHLSDDSRICFVFDYKLI